MILPTYVYDSRTQLTSPVLVLYTDHDVRQIIDVMFKADEHEFLIITKTKMHAYERDPFKVYKPTKYAKKREVENQNYMLDNKCTNLKHSLKIATESTNLKHSLKIATEKINSLSKINQLLVAENTRLIKEIKS